MYLVSIIFVGAKPLDLYYLRAFVGAKPLDLYFIASI